MAAPASDEFEDEYELDEYEEELEEDVEEINADGDEEEPIGGDLLGGERARGSSLRLPGLFLWSYACLTAGAQWVLGRAAAA
jgi:hypothetical protein